MSRAIQDTTVCREALSHLAELDLSELRQQWRSLYAFSQTGLRKSGPCGAVCS